MQTVIEAAALEMQFNYDRLLKQVAGLSHEDSLLQLPFRGNCLNWIVGHIVATRNRMFEMFHKPQFWTPEEIAIYARGSDPITAANSHTALRLEKMVADYDQSQSPLLGIINAATEEDLAKPFRENDVYYWLVRYANHESYHIGQLEILRQLAGKNDAP